MPLDRPLHAVILAAGLGSRLRPLTRSRPKPLVEIHGTPILHNALSHLAALGVERTTIVVGYRKDDIRQSCGDRLGSMRINYVESEAFDRTGSAYSLWLARDALLSGEDALLLEGDVFFEGAALARLLRDPGDTAAIDRFDELMSGTAAVVSDSGIVCDIRMNQTAGDPAAGPLYKTVNLFRFTARTLRRHLVPALDSVVASGECRTYVEELLATLVGDNRIRLRGALCDDLRWFEIDSTADLRIAERIFRRYADDRDDRTGPAFGSGLAPAHLDTEAGAPVLAGDRLA